MVYFEGFSHYQCFLHFYFTTLAKGLWHAQRIAAETDIMAAKKLLKLICSCGGFVYTILKM